jgi:hypothetical protein
MNLRRVGAMLPAAVTGVPSRRGLLHGLASAGLGLGIVWRAEPGEAKKKRKRRKKRKITRNSFGCVNVGGFCKNSSQCCSGICLGKKDKKRCQAHDASTCEAGQTDGFCSGVVGEVGCVTSTDGNGVCLTTTGNGPYCAISGGCFPCKTDADCVPFCGPAGACIACPANCADAGGTMCAGQDSGSCAFS